MITKLKIRTLILRSYLKSLVVKKFILGILGQRSEGDKAIKRYRNEQFVKRNEGSFKK